MWVKFKITKSQEFVIGGYTSHEGTRKLPRLPAGRLLESRWARLFRQSRIRLLRKTLGNIDALLQKLRCTTCPFINLPEKTKGRWGFGITPAVMKRCQWVKPVLVAQIKFTEWTHDDR